MIETVIAVDRERFVERLFPKQGLVVEVGVSTGYFAKEILARAQPKHLFLVDCWREMGGLYAELDPDAQTPGPIQEIYRQSLVHELADKRGVSLLCMLSSEAAEVFADGCLDAVYLDADHTAPGISNDLRMWWPKVRRGGILSGHDFCTRPWIDVEGHVRRFVEAYGLDELFLSGESDYQSWAVMKP